MVHRQETVGLLGIPVKQYIKVEDAESILRAIRSVPDGKPIDMIIHTPGGILFSAYQIAKALKEHKGKVTVFIPHYAMSGGTLIAIGADKIVMDKDAILGPVDPQLVHGKNAMPAVSLANIPGLKKWNNIDDSTVVLIDQAKKSLRQVRDMVKTLLADHTNPEILKKTLNRLVGGQVTHDYPIFPDEAKEIGLPVSTDMPHEVYSLMALYPQPSSPSITRTK
jgi:ClpP class serine protease